MSKITKPNFTDVWSSAGSKTTPSSLKIQTGWVGEKPPYEYWNWAMNRNDVGAAYSFQMGIAEWDSTVEYQYSASYKSYVQRNGLVYKALQTGTNKNPLTQPTYWALAFDDYGSAATVQTNLNTHITNYGTLASLSDVATARTNLDVYSKDEGDARYAALAGSSGQRFSAANGTTGYEVVNKSQLDTKAALVGSNGQEFAVATATTGDSAVNKTQFDAKTSIATDTQAGIVEKATLAELVSSASDRYPDAALLLNGYLKDSGGWDLPSFLGGLQIRTGTTTLTQTEGNFGVSFNRPFSNSCDFAMAIYENTGSVITEDLWFQIVSKTTSGATFYLQAPSPVPSGTRIAHWFAIGR